MRVRLPSLLSLCVAAGCVEDVPIAVDCLPDRSGPCLVVEYDGGVMKAVDAGAQSDASAPDDATTSGDASSEPLPPLPPLGNLSFEFSSPNSVAGEVTSISNLTATTAISPWNSCAISNTLTGVWAETGLAAGTAEGAPKVDVQPSDGRTFITIGYLGLVPMPLLQRLSTPLRMGQRYAFAIDALTTSASAQLSLKLLANDQGCLATSLYTLFESSPVTSSTWSTLCVSFTAPADLSYLILAAEPNSGSSTLLSGPRLGLDRIREATTSDCPNL